MKPRLILDPPPLRVRALAVVLVLSGCTAGILVGGLGMPVEEVPAGASELPCDVEALLRSRCWRCHGAIRIGGAPMSLLTRAQLLAASFMDPTTDFAHRALLRMQDMKLPMPPEGGATADEVALLKAWVDAGAPAGRCDPPDSGLVDMTLMPYDSGPFGSGLPCDVAQTLASRCEGCHGDHLAGGAPIHLRSRDDLIQPSFVDPLQRYARRAFTRMRQGTMPPGGGATAAEIAAFQSWIDADFPVGACDPNGDGGVRRDPLNAAPVCTSGRTQAHMADGASPTKNPGEPCLACHKEKMKPVHIVAGTVYPTGHEPDLCEGIDADALGQVEVVITDNAQREFRLRPNRVGNFWLDASQGLVLPLRAKVVYQGRTRSMFAQQMGGDCNSCHTQSGANAAPGRITLPME